MTEATDDARLHWKRLAGVYLSSPTNADGRTRIAIEDRLARIELDVDERLHHAANAAHGAHLFKVLDDAAFFACNSIVPDVFVLTVSFHVDFFRPVASGTVYGTGRVVRETKRILFADSEIVDGDGKLVARGSGSFMPSRIELTPEIGYE